MTPTSTVSERRSVYDVVREKFDERDLQNLAELEKRIRNDPRVKLVVARECGLDPQYLGWLVTKNMRAVRHTAASPSPIRVIVARA